MWTDPGRSRSERRFGLAIGMLAGDVAGAKLLFDHVLVEKSGMALA